MQSDLKHSQDFKSRFYDGSPFTPNASSMEAGWKSLQAIRYIAAPDHEIQVPRVDMHRLVLVTRPPRLMDLRYEESLRRSKPFAGWISVLPAQQTALWRWAGPKDSLHVFLDTEMVARVAWEMFGADAERLVNRPLEVADSPELRTALQAVEAELRSGGLGGALLADSLGHVLAVHLVRYLAGPRRPVARTDARLPQRKVDRVSEYIIENIEKNLSLEEMATMVHLSPYHFARQFKQATGLPPHQFVIAQRIERAREMLLKNDERPLAEVAVRTGFSDQSQFTFHFKRIVGVTPGQFRIAARSS